MSEFNVEHAFDPEARQAQLDLDSYIATRPLTEEDQVTKADSLPILTSKLDRTDIMDVTPDMMPPERRQATRRDRIGRMLDDVRDNIENSIPPYAAIHEGLGAKILRMRLLPNIAAEEIRKLSSAYDKGHTYRFVDHVGKKENKTYHPHYYFLDNTDNDAVRLYFVDPEHKIAHINIVRPSIVNLVGIEVPHDKDESPKATILRYQVPEYDPLNKPKGMSPNELLSVAKDALHRQMELPKTLSGSDEHRVLFALSASDFNSRVQARYSSKKQIECFAGGGIGSSALEGKVQVQLFVIEKLMRLFAQPDQVRKLGSQAVELVLV